MTQSKKLDVLIIGAGLSGLCSAYHLIKKDKQIKIIEAQERVGGRILTQGYEEGEPLELGATWLGAKHTHLRQILSELGIDVFEQNMGRKAIFEPISTSPPYLASLNQNAEPSFRIKGGSTTLINHLLNKIGQDKVLYSEKILAIKQLGSDINVISDQGSYLAKKVITTIPPNLLVNTIEFLPSLSNELLNIAGQTHTWMDDSIKVGLAYKEAFWKTQEKSGTIMSNVGPVHEMYEHNDYDNQFFALKGFLNGSYYNLTREARLEKILTQLRKYYGPVVDEYTSYYEKVWRHEPTTYYPYRTHIVPHQNHGHAVYQTSFWNNQLVISGSETATVFPGYMEGAIYSGLKAVKLLYP